MPKKYLLYSKFKLFYTFIFQSVFTKKKRTNLWSVFQSFHEFFMAHFMCTRGLALGHPLGVLLVMLGFTRVLIFAADIHP